MNSNQSWDGVIIGAGAAGLMCAIAAGERGRRILVLDHAEKIGEKIRISGGGRCNFTHLKTAPEHYLSQNPRFCISALKRFTPQDFLARVKKHNIDWVEKSEGQLFCATSARDILQMLLSDCADAKVEIRTAVKGIRITRKDSQFIVHTETDEIHTPSLVIATGGQSIPKIGASRFALDVAKQFSIKCVSTRAALVPLVFDATTLAPIKALSGISIPQARVRCNKTSFSDALLFTHRGLSGPAILQISSYWHEGDTLRIDLAPGTDVFAQLKESKQTHPKQEAASILADILPKRLAKDIAERCDCAGRIGELSDKKLRTLGEAVNDWHITPSGSEGYRTAEVTLGGVDTRELSSKTFECNNVSGLYFVGEALDVTGQLGGFNFQWAWASGFACGQAL